MEKDEKGWSARHSLLVVLLIAGALAIIVLIMVVQGLIYPTPVTIEAPLPRGSSEPFVDSV